MPLAAAQALGGCFATVEYQPLEAERLRQLLAAWAYRFSSQVSTDLAHAIVLEVGGIALLPDGRPLVCTRRGEIWRLENAYSGDGREVGFELWAEGLQEPLGLLVQQEGEETYVYTAQRGELTRMYDKDGDGRADLLASTEVGSYVFFRRTALDMDRPPATQFGKVRIEP